MSERRRERASRGGPAAAPAPAARRSLPRSAAVARSKRTELWYVYVLECGDGTLYTGVSRDPIARFSAHQAGRGARYTRGRAPLRVVGVPFVGTKSAALSEEHRIKRLTRAQKLAQVLGRNGSLPGGAGGATLEPAPSSTAARSQR